MEETSKQSKDLSKIKFRLTDKIQMCLKEGKFSYEEYETFAKSEIENHINLCLNHLEEQLVYKAKYEKVCGDTITVLSQAYCPCLRLNMFDDQAKADFKYPFIETTEKQKISFHRFCLFHPKEGSVVTRNRKVGVINFTKITKMYLEQLFKRLSEFDKNGSFKVVIAGSQKVRGHKVIEYFEIPVESNTTSITSADIVNYFADTGKIKAFNKGNPRKIKKLDWPKFFVVTYNLKINK